MSVDAAAADRLPWLADEPATQPVQPRRSHGLAWAAALVAMVTAGGVWIGTRSLEQPAQRARHPQATTTVALPPPHLPAPVELRIPAQPQVLPSPVPEVRPSPLRQVQIQTPPMRSETRQPVKPEVSGETAVPDVVRSAPAPAIAPAQGAVPFVMPRPWNPRVVKGAAGRLVQVGAFGSVHQAKRGWWFMVRDYPAMAHLPAVVRETRNSKGRIFYRFDVGTTSQAHSEILCQRMTRIGLSCAVIGLPWKAKVER